MISCQRKWFPVYGYDSLSRKIGLNFLSKDIIFSKIKLSSFLKEIYATTGKDYLPHTQNLGQQKIWQIEEFTVNTLHVKNTNSGLLGGMREQVAYIYWQLSVAVLQPHIKPLSVRHPDQWWPSMWAKNVSYQNVVCNLINYCFCPENN